jgi:hypothetical protein
VKRCCWQRGAAAAGARATDKFSPRLGKVGDAAQCMMSFATALSLAYRETKTARTQIPDASSIVISADDNGPIIVFA